MADTKVNTANKHIEYALQDLEEIVRTLELYLHSDGVCDSQVQERCVEDESSASDVAWISQSDAMPPFKPKTPVSVTVEVLTSDNKIVKAIYDARVSIWLSAEEWYKPEHVVGWRCLPDV